MNTEENLDNFLKNEKASLSTKYNTQEWNDVEKSISQFEKSILMTIKNIPNENVNNITSDLLVAGDDFYIKYKNNINKNYDIIKIEKDNKNKNNNNDTNKNKKKENIKKVDLIKIENAKNKYIESLNECIKTFNVEQITVQFGLSSNIVEIKGITLLFLGWILEKYKIKYAKTKYIQFVLNIIVAIQKFINICQNFEGKSMKNTNDNIKISTELLLDLEKKFNNLSSIYNYNGLNIYKYAPELIYYTNYDKLIPNKEIKPRQHQIDLHNTIDDALTNGTKKLIIYNPMVGLGKTTSALMLSELIKKKKNTNEKYQNLKLLFVCNILSVRNTVSNMCYNMDVKFGIGSIIDKKTNEYKITLNKLCKNISECLVVITSSSCATEILLNNNENIQYILFHDEPNIGSDEEYSMQLMDNMNLLMNVPDISILSSATLPHTDKIKPIVEYIKKKYNNIEIDNIYSNEIPIGCDMKTFKNEIIFPHYNLQTTDDIKTLINNISICPFIGRIYTMDVVRHLYNNMKTRKIENLPNIDEYFLNIENLNSTKIRKVALTLLDTLSNTSNEDVQYVCKDKLYDTVLNNDNIEKRYNEDYQDNIKNEINYEHLGTYQSYRFLNTTLVATIDPITFALTNFKKLIEDIKNETIHELNGTTTFKSLKNVLKIYNNELNDFEKKKASFIKNNKKSENDLLKDLEDMIVPTIKFPSFGHINSVEHIKKYAISHGKNIIKTFIKNPISLETIDFDNYAIDDDIKILLCCGVGIISSSITDKNYNLMVLSLAGEAKLSYLICDVSICYGSNLPICRILITDEFSSKHHINTLFQLMGRAGRVLKSYKAEMYVSDIVANRFITYAKTLGEADIESYNMNNAFSECIKKKNTAMEDKIKEYEKILMPKIKKDFNLELYQPMMNDEDTISISKILNDDNKTFLEVSNISSIDCDWRNISKNTINNNINIDFKENNINKDVVNLNTNNNWKNNINKDVVSVNNNNDKQNNTKQNIETNWRRL